MALQLVLGEQDVQQLLVRYFVRCLYPLLQLVDVQVVLLSLEGGLEGNIKNPVMFLAASSYEVDSLAGLQDLVGQVVGEESWDHHVVELVLLRPELVVADIGVCFDEKLLKRVVNLASDHPRLYHRQDRRRNLLEDPANEVLCGGAPIEDVGVDGRADGAALQVLNQVGDHSEPLHPLQRLLDPQVELA